MSTPPEPAVAAEPAGQWTAPSDGRPSAGAERPELLVGAAFAGGLLLALILKRLGN